MKTALLFTGQVIYRREEAEKSRMPQVIRDSVAHAAQEMQQVAEQDGLDYALTLGASGDGLIKATCETPDGTESMMQGDDRFRTIPIAFLADIFNYIRRKAGQA